MAIPQSMQLRFIVLEGTAAITADVQGSPVQHLGMLQTVVDDAVLDTERRGSCTWMERLCEPLAQCTMLSSIVLEGLDLEGDAALALAGSLPSGLRQLSLQRNSLCDADTVALASSMRRSCALLTSLNLSHNPIADKGARAIAASFEYWPALRSLSLALTWVGNKGAAALEHALRFHPSLCELHLQGTPAAVLPSEIPALAAALQPEVEPPGGTLGRRRLVALVLCQQQPDSQLPLHFQGMLSVAWGMAAFQGDRQLVRTLHGELHGTASLEQG